MGAAFDSDAARTADLIRAPPYRAPRSGGGRSALDSRLLGRETNGTNVEYRAPAQMAAPISQERDSFLSDDNKKRLGCLGRPLPLLRGCELLLFYYLPL